uniref:Protein phosphatase 1 regulatory subunit 18 n=1 Tax=Chrysemys picta bellii TaxID=8478 RepID=A0A8C3I291_CHRPI
MASAPAPALPEWKLQLLERKRKEEEEREQQDRMAKMPAWKREIIERRRAKQGSGTSFSDPEGGGGGAGPPLAVAGPPGPEMGQKESTVLQEKIGPVHQNPFIQLEKRRKETAVPEAEAASAKAKQLMESLSTENLADGSYERPLAARKPPGSAQHRSGTPSPPRDLPGLTPSPPPFTVASYRSQFKARSEAWPESPPRRSPTGKAWGREAASPERGARHDGGSPGTLVPGPRSREANSPDRGAWHSGSTLAVVPGPQGTEAASPETGTRGDGSAMAPGPRGREAASPERGARPGGGALAVGPGLQAREAASLETGDRPGGSALVVGPGLQAREAASPERGARLGGSALALGLGLQAREAASPERRDGGGGGSGAVIPGPLAASPPGQRRGAGRGGGHEARGPGPRELGGPSALPHPAVQRRSGNTITINPRKAPVPAVENGVEGEGGPAAPEKAAGAPLKKRYPTAEEIQVIGGYLSLSKSCLAKNDPHRKKLKISFSESQLERTFQYPSEGSLLEEFGPPEELDAPACANPHGEDDEEEEELLLLHRGLPGVLRTKSLIVGESQRALGGAVWRGAGLEA